MQTFYLEVEDRRTGRKLVVCSSLQRSLAVDNINLFRNSVKEWLSLVDRLILKNGVSLKNSLALSNTYADKPSADKKAYFMLVQGFWHMAEIAQNNAIMHGIFSGYGVDIILRLHQLKEYGDKSAKINGCNAVNDGYKADVEAMRIHVIKAMSIEAMSIEANTGIAANTSSKAGQQGG